jgi:hypothetical protein
MAKIVTSSSDPLGDLATLLAENTKVELQSPDISDLTEESQL